MDDGKHPGPAGPPPHLQVMKMIMDAMPSRILAGIAQLGIPDAIGDGTSTAAEVAVAIDAYEPWVLRMLRAGTSLGVFAVDTERRFANTAMGDALRSDAPTSVRALGVLVGEPFHVGAWSGLADGVRSGEVPFERVHGEQFFDYLRRHADANAKFAAWMTQTTAAANEAILGAYDFSDAGTVLDVGGGQGGLLGAILAAAPHARGILFDLPEVVGDTTPLASAGVGDRCEVVGGDFFQAVPRGADVVTIKTVLHDWDDDACRTVLANCRAALGGAGSARLLIIESVLPDDCSPHPGFMMDINMMVLNHGGRERTASEYGAMLTDSGFEMRRVIPTMGPLSLVEAVTV